MPMRLNPVPGIKLQGMATAWPEELLGSGARKSDADVYAEILGPDWQSVLAERNWDTSRTFDKLGVRSRSWTRGTEVGSVELAIRAAEKALADAGLTPEQLDCIVAATCSPNFISSTVAAKVAKHLKTDAAAIDIRAGGAGGLNGLATAALYHSAGCGVSLVVAAEVSSKYLGEHDLSNALLFGDGAAAVVLTSDSTAGEAGLVGLVTGNSDWQGTAFTVGGLLPPTEHSQFTDYRFQRPDAQYRECLARNWQTTAQALKAAYPDEHAAISSVSPYAVTAMQIQECADAFGVEARSSLELLAEQGCIGCASPLAAMVGHWQAHDPAGGDTIASLAVAGGISWTGLLWRR